MSYSGPDGDGSCEFNYSKNKDIQSLGESLVAVASTIIEGARLELLLQHDPLGLDKEMGFLKEASADGRLQQMCAIQGILTKLKDDPAVMERVTPPSTPFACQIRQIKDIGNRFDATFIVFSVSNLCWPLVRRAHRVDLGKGWAP